MAWRTMGQPFPAPSAPWLSCPKGSRARVIYPADRAGGNCRPPGRARWPTPAWSGPGNRLARSVPASLSSSWQPPKRHPLVQPAMTALSARARRQGTPASREDLSVVVTALVSDDRPRRLAFPAEVLDQIESNEHGQGIDPVARGQAADRPPRPGVPPVASTSSINNNRPLPCCISSTPRRTRAGTGCSRPAEAVSLFADRDEALAVRSARASAEHEAARFDTTRRRRSRPIPRRSAGRSSPRWSA